jgi:1,4-dihydroxy-2-naphthoate octaprenyltransferase
LLLASASIHYANEYADSETDALTIRTPFSGGSGALQAYGAPREKALHAALMTLITGLMTAVIAAGFDLLPLVTLPLLALGIGGGWMYSLRPLRLAWRGWGELANAFLGGMLLPVWGFSVQVGNVDWGVILLSLPFMLHVFINLLATTWADKQADQQVGKFTLATRWPVARLRGLYFLVVALAYFSLFFFQGWSLPGAVVLLTIALLPVTLWAGYAYTRRHSPFPSVLVMVLFLIIQLSWQLVRIINPQVIDRLGL